MILSFPRCKSLFVGLALLGFSYQNVRAQNLGELLPKDPNVEMGVLPNGLTYYIRDNHKPEHKVELRLVVKAGSILETDEQQGLAHFMEHMNFNGTKNFQRNDLVSYLQSIGVQFGADLNANTGFDQTIFILPIPTDNPGNLEKGFQIIEDWAHNALLTNKDIDEERGVVLEESRLGKGADDRMMKKYFPILAQGSLYADRLPIGKDSIIKHFQYKEIREFYHDWYRPDLQAVIIVGDIDPAVAKKMLLQHFDKLKNPPNERARVYAAVSPRLAAQAMVVTDKEATTSELTIMYPYEKKPVEKTLGDYRTDIERQLVFAMLNRRLNDLAHSDNPPFPYASVDVDDMIHGYESLVATAIFGDDGPQKAITAITGELVRARDYGFTNDELDIAKKTLLNGMDNMYNERNTTDSKDYVDEYIRNFLDGEPFPGIVNEHQYFVDMIPGIQVSDLNAMIKSWTKNQNTFTLITAPDKPEVKLPTNAELLAMTTAGFNQHVAKAEDKEEPTSLMTELPVSGTLVSQKTEDGFGATTYTLSNGVVVTVKSTDFKSDEILMKGIKDGGSNSYGVADKSNVHFATNIVQAMGVGTFSPTDLEKIMAGKTASVHMSIGDIDDDINCSSSIKDFESMLQLLNLSITQPRKDEGLYEAFKSKQATMVQFISANPQAAFIDTFVKTLFNDNPLAKMVFPKTADLDKIDLDRSLQIYQDEFGTAAGYHFYISGNITPEKALPLIERYLGSIPSGTGTPSFKDNGVRPISGVHELKFHKGDEKKSLILSDYFGDAPFSEQFALRAAALAEVLNIKVIQDLREKMSDIYTGGFYADVKKEPYEHFGIILQLPCGPESVDTLIAAANIEINNLKANGCTLEDLNKVKSQWREKHLTDIKDNGYWTEAMENAFFWGRDKDYILDYDKEIDQLTIADIQAVAKQVFDSGNEFTAILYPAL